MRTRRHVPLIALVASLALAGCGGAVPAKTGAEEPLPPTPEGSLVALDRAEADLRLALGEPQPAPTQPGYAQPPSAATAAPATPPPAPPPPSPGADAPTKAESGGMEERPADPCLNACRALASMTRATEHLCGLAGNADARCESARSRVKSAGDRVRAHCPRCADGG